MRCHKYLINKILNGTQKIGGISYDLTNNDEFNSVMISPNIGLDIKFDMFEDVFLVLGVNMSKTSSIGGNNDTQESLSFNNTQLSFGVQININ